MSIHLPLRLYRPLHRQRLTAAPLTRFFSSTQPTLARGVPRDGKKRGRVDPVVAATAARHQQGKASSALQEEQMSDERNVPEDIGLVPGTFVHAPLFPLTRFSVTERLWYEWKWIRSRATAWFQLWRFKRSFNTNSPHMYWFSNRSQLKYKALQKYKHLYQSFAKADSKAISQLCISGVAKKFQSRIDARPPGLQMRWEMIGEPTCTIVSNLASPLSLPGYEETGIHQVIFRIRSEQKIKIPGTQNRRDNSLKSNSEGKVEEYLVLQRQFIRGSHKDWMIWGFTDFSTPATIERSEEYARSVNAFQAA